MADAAISFAVQKLGDALIQKVSFLTGVEEEVEWLKNELQAMQCFLKDAANKQGNDESIRKWIGEVREVAQDAEDAIETFTLKVDAPRRKRDLLEKWACFPVHISHLDRVGKEIASIRNRLDEISKRRDRYGIGNLGEVGTETSSARKKWELIEWRRRMAASYQKDRDVVGLNEDADHLLEEVILNERRKGLSLTVVLGMGGIGKSTLAKKIYNHPDVADQFEQRAWVVVSNEFAVEDIIKQIMLQLSFSLDPKRLKAIKCYGDEQRRQQIIQEMIQEMQRKHEEKLKEVESVKDNLRRQEMLQKMLRERLEGKRYFIVLDDVWEQTHWEALNTAFPDEQDKASRLLFTSRNEIITKHQAHIHKMRLLNQDESWELLLKTAFINGSDGNCPEELEDIGREILKKCHGLPLAITVAGGLLVTQDLSESGWKRVLKQMKDYHLETSEIGTNVSAILELSFHSLPSQLKPCFLCLGFFKEDAIIRAKRLVHIWVAQGFVQVQEPGEETAEEIATTHLESLVKRNLVQVKDMTIDDRVIKYCYVHDLLRELSIRKAKEEIGFESLVTDEEGSSSSRSSSLEKPRHRVVRGTGEIPITIESLNQNKHLRSLFLQGEGPINEARFVTDPTFWKSFELLRILDIEGSRLPSLPSTISALIGLRYLRLRGVGPLTLPSWLDVFKNLEVLDIADSVTVIKFPDVTWKLDSLRHLYIDPLSIVSNSMKISNWQNLETLKYVRSDYLSSDSPKMGLSCRKLGIQLENEWNREEAMGRLLERSSRVQVLHIRWDEWRSKFLPSPKPNSLTKLKLRGPMAWCPAADRFPQNISHLTLSGSKLTRNDPMQELGKLPKLLYLKLDEAIGKNKDSIKVSRGGFRRLKVLHLGRMNSLINIDIEESGMPELQRLQIYKCPNYSQIEDLRKCLPSVEITIIDD